MTDETPDAGKDNKSEGDLVPFNTKPLMRKSGTKFESEPETHTDASCTPEMPENK